MKNIYRLMASMFSTLLVLSLLLSSNTASAAGQGFPLLDVSYVSAISTTSKYKDETREDVYGKINTVSNKSLVFDDTGLSNDIVRTHNDSSFLHVPDGKVEILVYQEGVGGSHTRIDGALTNAVTAETVESVKTPTLQYSTVRYTIDYNKLPDKDALYTIFHCSNTVLTNPGASTPYTRYETNVYIYWDRSDLSPAPDVSFVYDAKTAKMVLSGADSTMEYRLKSATSDEWQPCTNETMYFDATGTANKVYYVRYSSNGAEATSRVKEVVLPGKRPAPAVTYSTTSEIISDLTTTMEIRVGDGNYTPISATTLSISDIVDTIPANETLTVNVRQAATDTKQAGLDKVLTLYPRSATPTSLVFNSVTTTLTGYTTAMQYQTDADTSWRSMTGTSLSLLKYASETRDVIVYVRMKPTSTNAASKSVEITIPKLLAGPTGTLEYDKEIISGLPNTNYQYSTSGTSWSNVTVTNGAWDISSLISSSAKTLYLRVAATATDPVTASTLFSLPARPNAPTTPAFIYNDAAHPGKAVLTGLTNEMEYRLSTASTWTAATGADVVMDIPAASATYQIRYQATANSFCSKNKSLTLLKAGSSPAASYNTTTELVSGLKNTMEIKIGTGSYVSVESGVTTYDMSSLVNGISTGSTLRFTVRTKATATAPASTEKEFTIYPRLAAPSTVVFNYEPYVIGKPAN